MSAIGIFFIIGFLATIYLIYRLLRYSPWWRHQPIGRAFMATKLVLLAVFTMALLGNLVADWQYRNYARWPLTIFADVAMIYAASVVVRLQRKIDRDETAAALEVSENS